MCFEQIWQCFQMLEFHSAETAQALGGGQSFRRSKSP